MGHPSDFSLGLPLPVAQDLSRRAAATHLEDEVVSLFDELRDRLLRYLMCLGVPVHDGEEIIQESFLLLFQHLQQEKSRENLRGWMFRVARNLAFKLHRDNQSNLRKTVPLEESLVELQVRNDPSPEQQACQRQRQQSLWAVVNALPELDRSCLFLRAEGLRYREIGEALGISLGSVAASLARSLSKLARADGGSI